MGFPTLCSDTSAMFFSMDVTRAIGNSILDRSHIYIKFEIYAFSVGAKMMRNTPARKAICKYIRGEISLATDRLCDCSGYFLGVSWKCRWG